MNIRKNLILRPELPGYGGKFINISSGSHPGHNEGCIAVKPKVSARRQGQLDKLDALRFNNEANLRTSEGF